MANLAAIGTFAVLTFIVGCDDNSSNGSAPLNSGTSATAGASGAGDSATVSYKTTDNAKAGASALDGNGPLNSGGVGTTNGSATKSGTGGSLISGVDGTHQTGGSLNATGNMATGGSVSSTGGTTGSNTGGGEVCNYPDCLIRLYSACLPTTIPTSCITQESTVGNVKYGNVCYGDGTGVISTTDTATLAMSMSYKMGGSACYGFDVSVNMTANAVTGSVITYKDSSGSVVATETWVAATDVDTVTCTGGQPVVLNSACDGNGEGVDLNCQPGICNL